jgi:hypothetical protein
VAGASPSKAAQVAQHFEQQSMSFEVNQGQANASAQFVSRGNGYTLLLSSHEAVLNMLQPVGFARDPALLQFPAPATSALHMEFIGANPTPRGIGLEELPGRVEYIGSKNPIQSHNISTYARVEYQNLYAGINLVYYGRQGQLEYDFVLAPGADPRAITLSFTGADRVQVNGQGDLVLHTALGVVVQHKPVVYQEKDGIRQEISAAYVVQGQQVDFCVAPYDSGRPLIIDPTVVYSTYLGGAGVDQANGIAVDAAGNAYVAGVMDLGSGPVGFVVELDPTGSTIVYTVYLSSPSSANGIAVDSAGDAYVVGVAAGSDGSNTAFVTELDPTGAPIYNTPIPGPSNAYGVAVDAAGSAYVTGATVDSKGNPVAFAAKVSPNGSTFEYTGRIPGTIAGSAIAVTAPAAPT